MQIVAQAPKPRSDAARALADPRYKNRVVRDKKKYSRKGRNSSMRKFEDSIQPGNDPGLIEPRRTCMKILMLDDQCSECIRFKIALERDTSVSVVFVETPAEAEKALSAGAFDLLLLDGVLGIGGPYGPDVLREWISRGIKLPAVYMVSSNEEMQKRGVEAGAAGALDKAFIFEGDLAPLKELLAVG